MYGARMCKCYPSLQHETTEIAQLIAEIDSRLGDCRSIVSQASRSVSRSEKPRCSGSRDA